MPHIFEKEAVRLIWSGIDVAVGARNQEGRAIENADVTAEHGKSPDGRRLRGQGRVARGCRFPTLAITIGSAPPTPGCLHRCVIEQRTIFDLCESQQVGRWK